MPPTSASPAAPDFSSPPPYTGAAKGGLYQNLSVKAVLADGTIHKVRLCLGSAGGDAALAELRSQLGWYGVASAGSTITLSYVDEDGDAITVGVGAELDEAVQYYSTISRTGPAIKLYAVPSSSLASAEPSLHPAPAQTPPAVHLLQRSQKLEMQASATPALAPIGTPPPTLGLKPTPASTTVSATTAPATTGGWAAVAAKAVPLPAPKPKPKLEPKPEPKPEPKSGVVPGANPHKVFVHGYIDSRTSVCTVRRAFTEYFEERYGPVSRVFVVKNDDGTPKGYAFVEFDDVKSAAQAIADGRHELLPEDCPGMLFTTKPAEPETPRAQRPLRN